jgi:hypothetical protein
LCYTIGSKTTHSILDIPYNQILFGFYLSSLLFLILCSAGRTGLMPLLSS